MWAALKAIKQGTKPDADAQATHSTCAAEACLWSIVALCAHNRGGPQRNSLYDICRVRVVWDYAFPWQAPAEMPHFRHHDWCSVASRLVHPAPGRHGMRVGAIVSPRKCGLTIRHRSSPRLPLVVFCLFWSPALGFRLRSTGVNPTVMCSTGCLVDLFV